jgi:murein DD-endopeptidase MepM/ murein hydrolase activator NlpD
VNSVRFKGIVIPALCAAVSLVISANPFSAKALTQSEYKNKIASFEARSAQITDELKTLQESQASYAELKAKLDERDANMQQQIDLVESQVKKTSKRIAALESEIKQLQLKMVEKKDKFRTRLRAIYVTADDTELALLLSAKDFSDFLARAQLLRGVTKRDGELISSLYDSLYEISVKKLKVQAKQNELNQLRQSALEKQKRLNANRREANKALESLAREQANLEKEAADIVAAKQKTEREWAEIIKSSSDKNKVFSGGKFVFPYQKNYYISCPFGQRPNRFHTGVDFTSSGAYGAPIYAAADGTVIKAVHLTYSYGNYIIIDHGKLDGKVYTSLYAHCSALLVKEGADVKAGQLIGYVGSTGNSTGPHLHYEIRVNGAAVNPMNYYR